jgi:uncharacterized protein (DUF2344 family)
LFELELLPTPETTPVSWISNDDEVVIIRYLGGFKNDGTQLRPEQVIYLFQQVSQQEIKLLHIHRQMIDI